jgi:hypothetical protein
MDRRAAALPLAPLSHELKRTAVNARDIRALLRRPFSEFSRFLRS